VTYRAIDTTPKSREKYDHERYRRQHPEPAKNQIGIPTGTVKDYVFSRLHIGGTALEIAGEIVQKFPKKNLDTESMRSRVMQYVSEFRVKYSLPILSIGSGKNTIYKLRKP
jgi:hypothetical protein